METPRREPPKKPKALPESTMISDKVIDRETRHLPPGAKEIEMRRRKASLDAAARLNIPAGGHARDATPLATKIWRSVAGLVGISVGAGAVTSAVLDRQDTSSTRLPGKVASAQPFESTTTQVEQELSPEEAFLQKERLFDFVDFPAAEYPPTMTQTIFRVDANGNSKRISAQELIAAGVNLKNLKGHIVVGEAYYGPEAGNKAQEEASQEVVKSFRLNDPMLKRFSRYYNFGNSKDPSGLWAEANLTSDGSPVKLPNNESITKVYTSLRFARDVTPPPTPTPTSVGK